MITVKYKRNHKKIICWISSEAEHSSCKRKVRISKFLSSSNVSNILHIVFGSVKPLDYSIKTQLILFPCFWCVRENKVHLLYILYTLIAQLVEQQIFNLFVVGSIPTGRTKEDYIKSCGKGIASTLWLELANDKWLLVVMSGRTCMSQLLLYGVVPKRS